MSKFGRAFFGTGSSVSSHNESYRAAGRASMVAYERNPARHADQAPYDRPMAAGRVLLNTYFDDDRETTISMDRTIQGQRITRSVGRSAHDAYHAIFDELPEDDEYDRDADYLAALIAVGNSVGVRNDPSVVAARTAVQSATARGTRINKDAYIDALTSAIVSAAYIAAGKAAIDTYHSARNTSAASETGGRDSRRKAKSKKRKQRRTLKTIKYYHTL